MTRLIVTMDHGRTGTLGIWTALLLAGASVCNAAAVSPATRVPAPEGTGAIEGVVLDPDGHPVADALVAAVPETQGSSEEETRSAGFAHTESDGRFRFGNLKTGTYGLTASMTGHAAAYLGSLNVRPDSTLRGARLQSPGAGMILGGSITTSAGEPLPGAELRAVRYSDFLGDVFYAHADTAGKFLIEVPQAAYQLTVVAPGRETMTRSRQAEEARDLSFALPPLYPAGPAPDSVVGWFRRTGIPLRTVEAGHGFDDMRPIGDVVGDARVVALGEATHGTREFFQLKHRMLEYLVSEKGFTVFGIEASMPEAFALNDYVLTGRGDPAAALQGLYFWTWDTQEVLDMIRWMRRYDADPAHPRKVKFYGFDMQFAPRAVKTLVAYLRRVDPVEGERAAASLALIGDAYAASRFGTLPLPKRTAVASALTGILSRMDSRRADFSRATGDAAWALARQHGAIASQFVANAEGPSVRDEAMAENIGWILDREGPDAKMVVWAHNGHVSCSADEGSGMGARLRRMLGDRLVVFGFAFDQGSFQAVSQNPRDRGLRDFSAAPALVGSLDETLSRTRYAVAAFPLGHAPTTGPVAEWLGAHHFARWIGAGYNDSLPDLYFARQLIPRHYDALLFVDRTTAALPNRPRTAAMAPPDTSLNLDFEAGRAGEMPAGWVGNSAAGSAYQVENSRDRPRQGAQCAEIRALPLSRYGEWSGTLLKTMKAAPYAGKRIRLRAAVRVQTGDPGCHAHLWVRVWERPSGRVVEGPSAEPTEGVIRSTEWHEYDIETDIPADATAIDFGLALVGSGTAWLDEVSLETVGGSIGR